MKGEGCFNFVLLVPALQWEVLKLQEWKSFILCSYYHVPLINILLKLAFFRS